MFKTQLFGTRSGDPLSVPVHLEQSKAFKHGAKEIVRLQNHIEVQNVSKIWNLI